MILGIIIAVVVAVIGIWTIGGYNGFIKAKNTIPFT